MYKELNFRPTQDGRNQCYTRICSIPNLKVGTKAKLVISVPDDLKKGDGLQIPEATTYNFLITKIISKRPHGQRENKEAKRYEVMAKLITTGSVVLVGQPLTIYEYAVAKDLWQ